ncbi:MAG: Holliday junction helicase, RuvA subunit [Thermoleophilia bacterium]|nr:Holliday junction helicase, RuvA subunit [Thermoleophilia bacterium]MCZ4496460.1 Holliday junction helicase, RuvA subunit [Thermoleophilia bacterium]
MASGAPVRLSPMIARLTGRCVHADADSLIVDVGGVGYLVRATTGVLVAARTHPEEVTVHIHTSVREDAIQLFGFASVAEQSVFERLTSLQGVGPKVAIGVLSSLSPQDVRRATDVEDVALLQSVPGVGPKVARRIVTELKGKLDDIVPPMTTFAATVEDGAAMLDHRATFYEAREALVGLGMGIPEADAALAGTAEDATAAERVKQALAATKKTKAAKR